ncbi:PAS domain-containing protein [Phormidesmis priestleyi]
MSAARSCLLVSAISSSYPQGVAVTYFLSAKFAFSLVRLGTNAEVSALYPPAGISLAAFVGVTTVMALMLAAAIAERQQAEDLLRKQEASLTNAQRVAQIGNWDWDESPCSTQISLSWSDELYRILGFVPRSIPPSQEIFLQRVHRDDREQVRQALERARLLYKPYRLCYRLVLPNNLERTVTNKSK